MARIRKTIKPDRSGLINMSYEMVERAAVLHYLIYNNKTDAYAIIASADKKDLTEASFRTMAQKFFASEEIKFLMEVEKKKLVLSMPDVLHNLGLNSPNERIDHNYKDGKHDDLSKIEALSILTRVIKENKGDSKIIKELMPLLSKLKSWEDETTQELTNITFYELPRKEISPKR